MDERYLAADIAGYCRRLTAWKIVKEMSDALMNDKNARVSPFLIGIKDDGGFELLKTNERDIVEGFDAPETLDGTFNEVSQVWSLAASIFYIVMGCQIMNGKGGRGQLETSRIPYMRSELPQLSELVQQCLNFHPEMRPSMKKVNEIATKELQRCTEEVRKGPKFRDKKDAIEAKHKDETGFWPEAMMLLLLMLVFQPLAAQKNSDEELQHLIGIVNTLRQDDVQQQETAWNNASEMLGHDQAWTIMDEITPHSNECRLTDRKVRWFALNRILSRRMGYEVSQVRGDFNNGEDPNFNYSLIERSIKANRTVNYDLKSREGEQTFVIMPFDINTADIKAEMYRDSVFLAQGIRHKDGNIYLNVNKDKNVVTDDVLSLVISNNSEQNVAVIIINHNTRDKE